MSDYFLGFDLSTQQLKIIVTNDKLKHLNTYSVEFDKVFKDKYGIHKGVIVNEDEVVSPAAMWLDAIDYIFDKMKNDGFEFNKVRGLSGSCQQHGSIYWSENASEILCNLSDDEKLADQMKNAFTFPNSPNWQDHSTGKEIEEFEKVAGSADDLAIKTGSRAHYRFTGLQIRKLAKKSPDGYKKTKRISLVSSFLASIMLGKITNIEEADGCGMNLYDLIRNDYDDELLSLAAGVHPKLDNASQKAMEGGIAELRSKLGKIDPISYESLGSVAPYFVKKYGFNKATKVYSFTGDNLATIISLPLAPNDCLVSLGTSTTVLIVTKNYKPSSQYHLFKHPTMPDHYMGMICYCNGSLAREKVRDALNQKHDLEEHSWDKFNDILDNSRKFNNELGVYFPLGEIVPNASAQTKRVKLRNDEIIDVESWDVEEDVTSIIESQTLSCRLRTGPMLSKSGENDESSTATLEHLQKIFQDLSHKFGELYTDGKKQTFESLTARPNKCFYVGGASNNFSIINKMGSILGAMNGNFKVEIPNACALGGAYKASWSFKCESDKKWIDFNEYINSLFNFDDLDKFEVRDEWEAYFGGLGLLAKLEQHLKHD